MSDLKKRMDALEQRVSRLEGGSGKAKSTTRKARKPSGFMKFSARERKCCTCHNQAIPVIALTEVAKHGFAVDHEILQQQLQHTWEHLEKGKVTYQAGSGQGGQPRRADHALPDAHAWQGQHPQIADSQYPRGLAACQAHCGAVQDDRPLDRADALRERQDRSDTRAVQTAGCSAGNGVTAGFRLTANSHYFRLSNQRLKWELARASN